jgi:hypothetical protein
MGTFVIAFVKAASLVVNLSIFEKRGLKIGPALGWEETRLSSISISSNPVLDLEETTRLSSVSIHRTPAAFCKE